MFDTSSNGNAVVSVHIIRHAGNAVKRAGTMCFVDPLIRREDFPRIHDHNLDALAARKNAGILGCCSRKNFGDCDRKTGKRGPTGEGILFGKGRYA